MSGGYRMSLPFIGRQNELEELRGLFKQRTASLVVIKGRRRIGKSRLAEEFAKDLQFYEFIGLFPKEDKAAKKINQRTEFVRQMKEQGMPGVSDQDWGDIFWQLSQHTQTGRTVILLDEISWMAADEADFLPKLKNAWDRHFKKNPQLILILCGSISTWIDKNILSSTGFFGRISLELTLDELSLSESNLFLEQVRFKRSVYEKFKILSIVGGIPWYLEQIRGDQSADANIKRLCFSKNGLLVKEFKKIFHDLFENRGELYQKIVRALLTGPTEFNTIAQKVQYKKSGRLSDYLDALIKAGFIVRDFTWGIKTDQMSTLSRYRLRDNYLRFYLKYILPHLSQIGQNKYQKTTLLALPGWDSIGGLQFENLVLNNREYIYDALGLNVDEVSVDNPYFQRKTTKQLGCQIDYLIQTKYNTLFACEIKFSRENIGANIIPKMQKKLDALALPRRYSCVPVLIHINGVTDELVESDYFAALIDFSDFLK